MSAPEPGPSGPDFIRQQIAAELAAGRHDGPVLTRFPPEPNGYLHIGHAKSICLNFGVAREFGGRCNLRYDDTNPVKEDSEFVESIAEDVRWLGFAWDGCHFASDYFETLYQYALALIDAGLAYVDDQSGEQIRAGRGTLTEPGVESPWRDRSIAENRRLFEAMRAGQFGDGEKVLRAKIDMAAANINLRDPVLYRIRHAAHHRTGTRWCVYPMYDYTHCVSDAIEGITHSLCTLEFADHRPLYDWVLEQLQTPCHPQQIEFARLALEYTLVSKRQLAALVDSGAVDGWDDPRMPTLRGMRRRGFPPAALREFAARIGVTKKDATIEMGVLEGAVREALNHQAPRRMAVLDPIRVTLSNYPDGQREQLRLPEHPQRPELGQRSLSFGSRLFIEREDFAEQPPAKFKRLRPGGEVRLRGAYVIRCDEVIKDDAGVVRELRCHVDLETLGVNPPDRKVKGVIHWVDAASAIEAEVHLYDRLFEQPDPASAADFRQALNPDSLRVVHGAQLEASLAEAAPEQGFQFERLGYFCRDNRPASAAGVAVFNRTIGLRETWAR